MSVASLIESTTKVWLDGVNSGDIQSSRVWGITGGVVGNR